MSELLKRLSERGPRALRARLGSLVQRRREDGHVLLLHNGRSGSTLLGDMLDQHPEIFWDGETIEKMLHRLSDRSQRGIDSYYGELSFEQSLKEIGSRRCLLAGNKFFGTELQDYHPVMASSDITQFVEALKRSGFTRFISLQRNHIRKLVSHLVATKKTKFHVSATTKVELQKIRIDPNRIYIGHRFTTLYDALRTYQEFANETRKLLVDENALFLTYEDHIRDNPLVASEKVVQFLGLEKHQPEVNFGKTTDVSLRNLIENYEEVYQALLNSEFEADLAEAG